MTHLEHAGQAQLRGEQTPPERHQNSSHVGRISSQQLFGRLLSQLALVFLNKRFINCKSLRWFPASLLNPQPLQQGLGFPERIQPAVRHLCGHRASGDDTESHQKPQRAMLQSSAPAPRVTSAASWNTMCYRKSRWVTQV